MGMSLDRRQFLLGSTALLGATALWEQRYWEELDGHHASFLDPWGNQIIMWWRPDGDAECWYDFAIMEDVIKETKRLGIRVYCVGNASPFGREKG